MVPMKEKSWQTDPCFLLGNRKKVAEENQYVSLGFGKRKEEASAGVSLGYEECEVLRVEMEGWKVSGGKARSKQTQERH